MALDILVLYGSYRRGRLGIRLADYLIRSFEGLGHRAELVDAKAVGLPMLDLRYSDYPAGEAPIVAADGRALARAVRVGGKVEPVFSETVAELPAAIASIVKPGDVVLTMGAGSIGGVPARLRALGQGAE